MPDTHRRLEQWRCAKCRRHLAMFAIDAGAVQIKCRACGTVNNLQVRQARTPIEAIGDDHEHMEHVARAANQ